MDQSLRAPPHVTCPPSASFPKLASNLRIHTWEEWEQQRDVFTRLYLDEDLTLARAKKVMAEEYSFHATEAQYKTKIKAWGLEKNLDSKTTSAMLRIERRRKSKQDKPTTFKYKGRSISEDRMAHLRKKHLGQGETENILVATPPDVTYYTPRPDQRKPDTEGSPESNSIPMMDDNLPHSKPTNSTKSLFPDAIASPVEGIRNANLQSTLMDVELALTSRGEGYADRERRLDWDVVSGQPSGLQGQESYEIPSLSPMLSGLNCDQLIKVHSSDDPEGGYSLTDDLWMDIEAKSVTEGWIRDDSDDVVMSDMSPFDFESPSFRSTSYSSKDMVQPLATCCGVSLRTPYDISVHNTKHHTHKNGNVDLDGGRWGKVEIDEPFRAIECENEEMVRSVLENGADPSVSQSKITELRLAVYEKNEETVRSLLENGASARDSVSSRDGITVLHLAASRACEGIIQLLLRSGADPSIRNNAGETALHAAASMGRQGVVEILLNRGADHSIRNNAGETALHMGAAALWGHLDVVEMLLEGGADHSIQNNAGETVLHVAASMSRHDVVEILLTRGADHSIRNNAGETTLHVAASEACEGIIQLLLRSGADHSIRNNAGETALHAAASMGCHDVVEILLGRGADHSIRNDAGETALHVAASRNRQRVVEVLLDRGADHSIRNDAGETALNMAVSRGHQSVVEILLKNNRRATSAKDQFCP